MKPAFIGFSALALIAALLVPAAVHAQSWVYVAYDSTGRASNGKITLEEKGGTATFEMIVPGLDMCLRSPLKAAVERNATQIIITPEPRMSGCTEFRFVLNADGSGGTLFIKRGADWTQDTMDRKLTLIK
jgi:hypothetical protein